MRPHGYAKLVDWLLALALATTLAGCGCGDDDDSGSSNGDGADDDTGDDDAADDDNVDDDTGDDSSDDDTVDDDTTPPDIPAPDWSEPAEPTRSVTSLDGTWTFTPEGYAPRAVQVPCFWEAFDNWPGWEPYACPEYLAGTPDEDVDIIEGNHWAERAIHRGTYEKTVTLPDPSPVTRIHFEAMHHAGHVYWNEADEGESIGAYRPAVFDVSGAVTAGDNALRVELDDGEALLGSDGVTRWPAGYYAHTDITGLYRSVTLESLPDVYVSDVFVAPSWSRRDLTVRVEITNARDVDVFLWVRGRVADEDGHTALETDARPVTIRAGQTLHTVLVEPFPDARPWSPADPYLYHWRTLLMTDEGTPVDLREDRFGFREVGIEGGHFVLNGERLNLIGDSVDDQASRSRYWGPKYWSCDSAPDTIQRLLALNFNVARFHQAPPPDCVFDLADEAGLMVIEESPVYARLDILRPFAWFPAYEEHSKLWIDEWVRRLRNHPSIVMWSVENEMFMYGFGLSPAQAFALGGVAHAADVIHRPDGSQTTPRPVNWDGDTSFFRTWFYMRPETINWHYPFLRRFTILPDNEWFDDAIANFEPYLFDDVPTGVGETMDVRRPEWIEHTPDQAKAMQGIAVRAMRLLGYSDIRPYKLNWAWHTYDPTGHEHPFGLFYHSLYTREEKDALLVNIRASYHPIAVFDYEYTRTGTNADGSVGPVPLPADTAVTRTLVSLNDAFRPGDPIAITWTVFDEDSEEQYAYGAWDSAAPQGGRDERAIGFTTPAAGHTLVLRIRAEMENLRNGPYEFGYRFVTQ